MILFRVELAFTQNDAASNFEIPAQMIPGVPDIFITVGKLCAEKGVRVVAVVDQAELTETKGSDAQFDDLGRSSLVQGVIGA